MKTTKIAKATRVDKVALIKYMDEKGKEKADKFVVEK